MHAVLIAAAIGRVSLLYATAGQAGGTAFLAVMAFAAFPAAEMRGTALLLNIVAAGYATWQLHRRAANDATMLAPLIVPSLFTAFAGALIALNGPMYFMLTGLLLIAAGTLMVFRRTADTIEARPMQPIPAAAMGAAAGFISGLTGVGGGVFLAPILIALWMDLTKGSGRCLTAILLMQFHSGIRWRSLCRTKHCAWRVHLRSGRNRRRLDRHTNRATLDVRANHPVCSRYHSHVCRRPVAASLRVQVKTSWLPPPTIAARRRLPRSLRRRRMARHLAESRMPSQARRPSQNPR
jgi:uncharacterized membrane protein YfcA